MKHLTQAAVSWLRGQWAERGGAVRLAYRRAFPDDGLVMRDLARLCHQQQTTFEPGDAVTMAFREGQRSVLLHIASMKGLKASDLLGLAQDKGEGGDD